MNIKKNSLNIVLFVSIFAIVQFFIDFTYQNVLSTLITWFLSILGILYIKQTLCKGYFLSLLIVASVILSTQLGPLIFQTLYLTPVSFNLQMSYMVFLYTGVMLCSLILGHFIYVNSKPFKRLQLSINDIFKNKLILFQDVSGGFVLLLTSLSFFAIYFGGVNDVEIGDVGGKFLAIFSFFTMLPLVYFYQGIENNKRSQSYYFYVIGLYFIALVILGIMKNSRGTFANFALFFIFILFYLIYCNRIKITKQRLVIGLALIIPMVALFNFLGLVSGAILQARSLRSDINGFGLVIETFNILLNMHSGEISKSDIGVNANVNFSSYNEFYLNNDFLARLVTIKFDDNMLFYSKDISFDKYFEINQFFYDKTVSLLPQPLINIFTNDFNKSNYIYSYGDWIYSLAGQGGIGGFKLGSVAVSGLNLSGLFFYVILIIFSPFLFSLIDALSFRVLYKKNNYRVVLSVMSILLLQPIFMLFNGDSLMGIIDFLLRGLWQAIFAYCLLLFLYKFLFKLLKNS
ncbi:hypothetical protein F4V57_10585 [Acinetobacter qingfengensis]|uniref:O-antigen polysaccharide polymerase Wzy n=1 Tax=Acinetobacter qingfengensis TaxID=1262585 RepID=A0A1E7RCQ0_9GAMM|nr:hypothetical protein [Acinetobacter qingfengensis]KAA8732064.1 hypothetical protein F4V57_10585 [Acinetobacter qingfengensis]OEY97144.1 hypothetical protein BJI46_01565 [Acinetobacter qingfengensis]